MKKRIIRVFHNLSLGLVVGLTALAVLVSGAQAASRLFSVYNLEKDARKLQQERAEIQVSPSEAAETTHGMEPTGKPDGEPVGDWQSLPVLPGTVSPRGKVLSTIGTVAASLPSQACTGGQLTATPSQVSSCLGRLFTLVGAKPSGTS